MNSEDENQLSEGQSTKSDFLTKKRFSSENESGDSNTFDGDTNQMKKKVKTEGKFHIEITLLVLY